MEIKNLSLTKSSLMITSKRKEEENPEKIIKEYSKQHVEGALAPTINSITLLVTVRIAK